MTNNSKKSNETLKIVVNGETNSIATTKSSMTILPKFDVTVKKEMGVSQH